MTLKEVINNDICNSDIAEIIGEKIYYLQKLDDTENDIYIEWRFINKGYSEYAGDKPICSEALIQIDIFSKSNNLYKYNKLIEIVVSSLNEKEYDYVDEEEQYENDTELWHFGVRFFKKIIN